MSRYIDPITGDVPDLPYRPKGWYEPGMPDHAPTAAGLALFAGLRASLRPDRGAADWTDADRFDKGANDD